MSDALNPAFLAFARAKSVVLLLIGIVVLILAGMLPVLITQHDQQQNALYLTCAGSVMAPGDTCFYDGAPHSYQEWKADAERSYAEAQAISHQRLWIATSTCAAFGLLCIVLGGFPFLLRIVGSHRKKGAKHGAFPCIK